MDTADQMEVFWRDWHDCFDPDDVPQVNPSFKKGFESGREAGTMSVVHEITKTLQKIVRIEDEK